MGIAIMLFPQQKNLSLYTNKYMSTDTVLSTVKHCRINVLLKNIYSLIEQVLYTMLQISVANQVLESSQCSHNVVIHLTQQAQCLPFVLWSEPIYQQFHFTVALHYPSEAFQLLTFPFKILSLFDQLRRH